jgi:hypothetical protein
MNIPAESNLLSIAENIKHQTAALIQQLKSNSFTEPSLDAGCTTELWTTDRLELIASKNSIVALNKELIRLIGGPKSVLWDVGIHYDFAALDVILEFDVLENLPIDGEVHVSQLAEQSGLDEDKLLRLLRLLSCEQVVEEVSIAVFRHTAISMFLVKDKAMKALVGMQYVPLSQRERARLMGFADLEKPLLQALGLQTHLKKILTIFEQESLLSNLREV